LKGILALLLVGIIIIAFIVAATQLLPSFDTYSNQKPPSDFRFGVAWGGNTTDQAKLLIDRVKNYTNLFVVQSGPVSVNETAMNEIIDYAVAADLDVIVYFGYFNPEFPWQIPWLDTAKQRWGSSFLGVYLNDEPGGKTIDANWTGYFNQIKMRNSSDYYSHAPSPAIDQSINGSLPMDNSNTAYHYVEAVKTGLGLEELSLRGIKSFTSDYALYWFDYQGGYDTVFGQFGFNLSIPQTIGLTRGAANLQNKDWGVILTWTYDQPPYLVDGVNMYSQLLIAYMAGAQYAVIFNYPQIGDNRYGILTEDHFEAMEQFWNDIKTLKVTDSTAEAAYVLPYAYGWGMRSENDSIWGLWRPDSTSQQIWDNLQQLLSMHSIGLDIVYDDPQFPLNSRYPQVHWWNQSV
jgi:hypothetical protein